MARFALAAYALATMPLPSRTRLPALLLAVLAACGTEEKPAPRPSVHGHSPSPSREKPGSPLPRAEGALPDTAELSSLLSRAVRDGGVDYGLVLAERAVVDRYLAGAAKADVARHEPHELLAFYCNAFNAGVLALVGKHVALGEGKSGARTVGEVSGFFATKELIVGGQMVSLDEVEAKARGLGDPRFHFGLYRACRSSPPLPARAFEAASIDADLDAAVQSFLSSPRGLVVRERQVWASRLFEQHSQDFGGVEGVRAFLMAHAPRAAREYLDKPPRWLDWDGTLDAR